MNKDYYRGLNFKVRGKKKNYSYDKFVPGILVAQPSPTPTPTPTP